MSSSPLILTLVYGLLAVPVGVVAGVVLGYLLGGVASIFRRKD